MENKSENKPSVLNATIQDTKYRIEGNATYCDMLVKVKLNSFENQFYHFTPDFVRRVISEHLPMVKSVINYGYSDLKPIVAKYYILPGGPVKVLAFDKRYYKRYHNLDNDKLLNVGDIITLNDMVKVNGECVQYDYCQTFTVTGKAVCLPEDQFDEEKGKAIASRKAIEKGAHRVNRLYAAILGKTQKMMDEIKNQYDLSASWMEQAAKIKETFDSNENAE